MQSNVDFRSHRILLINVRRLDVKLQFAPPSITAPVSIRQTGSVMLHNAVTVTYCMTVQKHTVWEGLLKLKQGYI